MYLDDRMKETFAAIADALIVAPTGQRPSDLYIADRLGAEIFERLPHDGARGDLVQLLKLLGSQ